MVTLKTGTSLKTEVCFYTGHHSVQCVNCVYECSLQSASVLCLAPCWAFLISTDPTVFSQKPNTEPDRYPFFRQFAEETSMFVPENRLHKQVGENHSGGKWFSDIKKVREMLSRYTLLVTFFEDTQTQTWVSKRRGWIQLIWFCTKRNAKLQNHNINRCRQRWLVQKHLLMPKTPANLSQAQRMKKKNPKHPNSTNMSTFQSLCKAPKTNPWVKNKAVEPPAN